MIRAGKISEIQWGKGYWIILDIGFSNKSESCGLVFGDAEPFETTYGEAAIILREEILKSKTPVNLVIEAPLSVAFDAKGNPKARKPEKLSKKTRYWYTGPGVPVMVASMYLLQHLNSIKNNIEIRLFEGFVSFKKRGKKSDHKKDVLMLREAIKKTPEDKSYYISPDELKIDSTDIVISAFSINRLDFGVPPIIQVFD